MSTNLQYIEVTGEICDTPSLSFTPKDQTAVLSVPITIPPKNQKYLHNQLTLIFFGNDAEKKKDQFQLGDQIYASGPLIYYQDKKEVYCSLIRKVPKLFRPINQIRLMGRLTKDAEPFKFGNDDILVTFSVAHNYKEQVNYHNCTIFGKYGEKLLPELTKGKWVSLRGELVLREIQGKQTTSFREEVIVDQLTFARPEEPAS